MGKLFSVSVGVDSGCSVSFYSSVYSVAPLLSSHDVFYAMEMMFRVISIKMSVIGYRRMERPGSVSGCLGPRASVRRVRLFTRLGTRETSSNVCI